MTPTRWYKIEFSGDVGYEGCGTCYGRIQHRSATMVAQHIKFIMTELGCQLKFRKRGSTHAMLVAHGKFDVNFSISVTRE